VQDVEHSVRHGHHNSDIGVFIVEARELYVDHLRPPIEKLESPNGVRRRGGGRASEQHRIAFYSNREGATLCLNHSCVRVRGWCGVVVVVVGGGAVVGGVVSPAAGGLVAVGELELGWVRGLDAVSILRDDPAASSASVRVVLVSTCWVVVVIATVVVVVVDCVGISDSTVSTSVEVGAASIAEVSSPSTIGASGSVSIARIAAIPSAVGTSVTSLRTLPTAAAAMVTATTVAMSQAIPTPAGFLILVVWYTFSDSAMQMDNSSIRLVLRSPSALLLGRVSPWCRYL